jgi:hypothetical protein
MIRGVPACQPDWLRGEYAQRAYSRGREAAEDCAGLIWWDSEVAKMAANMAMYAASYIRRCQDAREHHGLIPEDQLAELEAARLACRGWLAQFLLLDADMVDAPGTIRPDGLDADIARLCGVTALQ